MQKLRSLLTIFIFVSVLISCSKTIETPEPKVEETTSTTLAKAPTPNFSQIGFSNATGGRSLNTVTPTTLADFKKFAEDGTQRLIRVTRQLSAGRDGTVIRVNSNKTILGVGSSAFLNGVGLKISGKNNIIIRNVKITMSNVTKTITNSAGRQQVEANDGDCISIENSKNIWIDHCELYSKNPSTQTNQDLYDGLIDAKGSSENITISWNYFHDHHKCHLIGSSDSDTHNRKITFHHNYYKNVRERLPSIRGGNAHVFNNYFYQVGSSAVNSRVNACVRVERNLFENVNNPIFSKNSDVKGQWDVNGNTYKSCSGSQPTTSNCSFTPPYSYSAGYNAVSDVKSLVTSHAGVGKI